MLEKTVAALKAEKAETVLFGKRWPVTTRTCETWSGNAARAQVTRWPMATYCSAADLSRTRSIAEVDGQSSLQRTTLMTLAVKMQRPKRNEE